MKYTVDLTREVCSCRLWQISSIACAHACCAIWHDGGKPEDYLDKKMPGQLKKDMRKSKNEPQKKKGRLGRGGMAVTCTSYGKEGHNKRGCHQQKSTTAKGTKNTTQRKGTGKEKLSEPVQRPQRNRKLSIKGIGLYTNLKIGKQTFYSGLGSSVGESSRTNTMAADNRKRKKATSCLGTQESSSHKKAKK
ncbi:hypothetical protein DITRI_Ditri06bG0100100 [Diplodiscus trichospermus]